MKIMSVLVAGLLSTSLLIATSPGLAQTTTAKPHKAKMVCRTQANGGSRIAQSLCLTEDQWTDWDAARKAETADLMNHTDRASGTQVSTGTEYGPGAAGPNGYNNGVYNPDNLKLPSLQP